MARPRRCHGRMSEIEFLTSHRLLTPQRDHRIDAGMQSIAGISVDSGGCSLSGYASHSHPPTALRPRVDDAGLHPGSGNLAYPAVVSESSALATTFQSHRGAGGRGMLTASGSSKLPCHPSSGTTRFTSTERASGQRRPSNHRVTSTRSSRMSAKRRIESTYPAFSHWRTLSF